MSRPTKPRFPCIREIFLVLLLITLVYACDTVGINSGTGGSGSGGGTGTGSTGVGSTGVGNSGSGNSGSGNSGNVVVSNPSGDLPLQAPKPQPPPTTFQGCPATGDGGDPELNSRKNRTDSAPWYPVSIASILKLNWPKAIEVKPRSSWSSSAAAEIAKYEGIPVQIEGYLAGARQRGPESCNCHSVNDVDNPLWVVGAMGQDGTQSVVAEVTPRIRALHPGWAFPRIQGVVDGQMKVRISGWLVNYPIDKSRGL